MLPDRYRDYLGTTRYLAFDGAVLTIALADTDQLAMLTRRIPRVLAAACRMAGYPGVALEFVVAPLILTRSAWS